MQTDDILDLGLSGMTQVRRRVEAGAGMLRAAVCVALSGMIIFGLSALTEEQRSVAAPALATAVTAIPLLVVMAKRAGYLPLDEIGAWYIVVIAVYATVPLAAFLSLGLEYTGLNDAR